MPKSKTSLSSLISRYQDLSFSQLRDNASEALSDFFHANFISEQFNGDAQGEEKFVGVVSFTMTDDRKFLPPGITEAEIKKIVDDPRFEILLEHVKMSGRIVWAQSENELEGALYDYQKFFQIHTKILPDSLIFLLKTKFDGLSRKGEKTEGKASISELSPRRPKL